MQPVSTADATIDGGAADNQPLAGLAAPSVGEVCGRRAARFPRRGHARIGEDDVRAAGGRRTARASRLSTQITVVVPTEHLKVQWAQAAQRYGLALDPRFSNTSPATSPEYHGVMVTYAQVASHPTLHRVRTEQRKTLVIFDEIHHGGDAKTWGDAIREAFSDATRRLALTGTPFRSDDSPIPFVSYTSGADGVLRSQADHTYGYAEALADGVVRPVVFLAYSGQARWRDSAGEEHAARLGEPLSAEQTARAWRTALDPAGEWMPAVIAAADQRLRQLRDARARRRRHDHRVGPDRGPRVRRPADEADRPRRRRRALRRPRIVGPHQPNSPRAPAAGWSRCGWSPKASTCPGCRSGSTPPAPRRRCSSPRRSGGSSGRGGRVKPRASSCRRCPTCCSWPASWRPSAITCSAQPHRESLDDPLARRSRRPDANRKDRSGKGFHLAGRRRRTGSGHLRRLLVRHRHPGRKRRGGRLPRHPRDCSTPTRCAPCCTAARTSSYRNGPPRGRPRAGPHVGCHARSAPRAAPRTQRPGVGGPSPHRQAARMDPQRTAPSLRRAADRRSDPRPAQGAH